ncbi:MAG: S8 family peptidase [Bacteroidales bacterium]|nr:S8 family peptidase [Bacteroidales bacterium]
MSFSLNTQRFFVYVDTNVMSMGALQRMYDVKEEISTILTDVVGVQVCAPNNNFDSVVTKLKQQDYVLDVEPVIGDSVTTNVSWLFYVQLRSHDDYPLLVSMANKSGAMIMGQISYSSKWYELRVDKNSSGNSVEVANQFWETGQFANVDPGFILRIQACSGTVCVADSSFDAQWGMQAIKACSAWKITTGDTSVRVAVIDMGVDENHKEFDSTHVAYSYDAETNSSPAQVYHSTKTCYTGREQENPTTDTMFYHGIHMGGIIFANHNRNQVAGLSPNASLVNISHKLLFGSETDLVKMQNAIHFADSVGTRVINCSWAILNDNLDQFYGYVEDAIDSVIAHGRIVVFSAGNEYGPLFYPANYKQEILVVGACDSNMEQVSGTAHGEGLDLLAPGINILSTHNNNGYIADWGTSMAAAHVSGVAALMLSINPNLSAKEVRDYIEQTAQKSMLYNYEEQHENGSWCDESGYGILDAHRAVLKAAFNKVYGDTVLTLCGSGRYTARAAHNVGIDSVYYYWTTSEGLRIMGGSYSDTVTVSATDGGMGHLCCHVIHDGDTITSSINIHVTSARTMFENVSLASNMAFPDTFIVCGKVTIDSTETITWQGKTVYCGSAASLVVRPGGKLILDADTLTNACAGEMWQGVEVVGDRTKHQNAASQGTVILRNGTIIENAHCAIKTRLGDDSWFTTGGIVQCSNSTFRNNRRAVDFLSYADTLSSGNIADNKSWFKDCTFTLDSNNHFLSQGLQFLNHATLWDVKGVSFEGCTFQNLITEDTADRQRAIYAEDAGFKVKTLCSILDNCVCYSTPDTCLFTGFRTAVEVNTTGSPYAVTLDEAKFTDNYLGVAIQGCNYASVTRCVFDLSTSPVYPRGTTGLFLDNSTGYLVEGNAFTAAANATSPSKTGIIVDNSGIQANSIYLNKLKNLDYGIVVRDTNGSLRSGLCLTCDTFENCTYGIYVEEDASVAPTQGSQAKGADNKFLGTQTSSLWNDGVWQINYYYSNNPQYMLYYSVGVNEHTNHVKPNSCLSTLCGSVGPVNPETNFSGLDVVAGGTGMPDLPASQGNASDTDLQAAMGNYYAAVRRIMADSVESLQDLAAWHTAAGVYADPYSLTEIGTTTGNAAGVSNMAQSQAGIFSTSSQMSPWERDNYADFRTLMDALRPDGNNAAVNWPAATPAQIDELQRIAEVNTGRSSTMAKGVLCFFFDICYEEEEGEMKGHLVETFHGTSLQDGTSNGLLVYPNPTDNLLNVESTDDQILHTVWVYDSFGRTVATMTINSYFCTVDLHHLDNGIYFLRALKSDGGETMAKIVKNSNK